MSQSQLCEDISRAAGRSGSSSPRASQAPARVEGFLVLVFSFTLDGCSAVFQQVGVSRLTAAPVKASSLSCHVLRSWTIKTIVISRVGTQTKAF